MSFAGHVLWKRKLIGPCAFTTLGKPSAAAPRAAVAEPVRNLRRGLLTEYSGHVVVSRQ